MIVLGTIAEWREPDGAGVLTTGSGWIRAALFTWIPVYLLISLKRVYGQGWALTLGKYFAIGISYLVLLGFATAFVAVLSFVLL
jgi:ABC-type multidrug transport system permease subunit